jgi:hypothetical protein
MISFIFFTNSLKAPHMVILYSGDGLRLHCTLAWIPFINQGGRQLERIRIIKAYWKIFVSEWRLIPLCKY